MVLSPSFTSHRGPCFRKVPAKDGIRYMFFFALRSGLGVWTVLPVPLLSAQATAELSKKSENTTWFSCVFFCRYLPLSSFAVRVGVGYTPWFSGNVLDGKVHSEKELKCHMVSWEVSAYNGRRRRLWVWKLTHMFFLRRLLFRRSNHKKELKRQHGFWALGPKRILCIGEQRVVEWCHRPGRPFVSQCKLGTFGQGVRFHVPVLRFLLPTYPLDVFFGLSNCTPRTFPENHVAFQVFFPKQFYCRGSQCCLKRVRLGWDAVSASLVLSLSCSGLVSQWVDF